MLFPGITAFMNSPAWPELPWNAWSETAGTLHMWTQIVRKNRLALTPLQNHWWMSSIRDGARVNYLSHVLRRRCSRYRV